MEAKEQELKQAEEFGAESAAIAQRKNCQACSDSFELEIEQARQAGIKEVVGWFEEHKLFALVPNPKEYIIFREEWEAFLKEKGIEE